MSSYKIFNEKTNRIKTPIITKFEINLLFLYPSEVVIFIRLSFFLKNQLKVSVKNIKPNKITIINETLSYLRKLKFFQSSSPIPPAPTIPNTLAPLILDSKVKKKSEMIYGLEKGYIQDLKKVNFENPKLLNDCILAGFISSKYSFKSLVAEKNVMISKLINPVKLPIPIRLTSIAAITKAGTVLKIEKHTVKNLARYLLDIFVAKKGEHKTAKRTPIKDEAKAVIIVSNILNKTIFLSSASILIIPAIRPFNLEKPSI